ncbi:MAG: DUF2231 domain-containing protein [Sphingomonadales bacterium]|nr:DUF2231 domain-containing protein [Sphingomonadales bacterium]
MLGRLHPFFVHFPIALLMSALVAHILFWWRKHPSFLLFSRFLLVGAALGALLAALSGGWAEDAAGDLSAEIHEAIEQHETLGYVQAWLLPILAIWGVSRRKTMLERELSIFFGVMMLASVLMLYTGYLGGGLVYDQGVGVERSIWSASTDTSTILENP